MSAPIRALCLAAALALCGASAPAQGHGGGMGGGRGMGVPGPGMPDRGPGGRGPSAGGRPGGQLAPAGRWWDDKKVARTLGLNGDQQTRMDGIFSQNRDALLSRYENLQREESKLEQLVHADHPTEAALFAQIDRVAQARADLEKTNAHMQLQLRGELTSDQVSRLQDAP